VLTVSDARNPASQFEDVQDRMLAKSTPTA